MNRLDRFRRYSDPAWMADDVDFDEPEPPVRVAWPGWCWVCLHETDGTECRSCSDDLDRDRERMA